MQIADEEMQLDVLNIQIGPPASPVNYLVDEIPLNQLEGPRDEGFLEQPEQPDDIHMNEDIQMNEDHQPQGPYIQMNEDHQPQGPNNLNNGLVQEQ